MPKPADITGKGNYKSDPFLKSLVTFMLSMGRGKLILGFPV